MGNFIMRKISNGVGYVFKTGSGEIMASMSGAAKSRCED